MGRHRPALDKQLGNGCAVFMDRRKLGAGDSCKGLSIQQCGKKFAVAQDGKDNVPVTSDDLGLSLVAQNVLPGLFVVVVVLAACLGRVEHGSRLGCQTAAPVSPGGSSSLRLAPYRSVPETGRSGSGRPLGSTTGTAGTQTSLPGG